MQLIKCETRSPWAYEVHLNRKEWPAIDVVHERWLQRPIYVWVAQNCGQHIFSPQGWIMFRHEHDAVQFQLTWSK